MTQTASRSSDFSTAGERKDYLDQVEREKLVDHLSQDRYKSQLVRNPDYDQDKLEHNLEVVDQALADLYNTSLKRLTPKGESLTLIRLNLAGVDLNVCPNYSISLDKEKKPRLLNKKCSAKDSYQSYRDASECEGQIVDKLCPVLTRKKEAENKSWEEIIRDLSQQNHKLRADFEGKQIREI